MRTAGKFKINTVHECQAALFAFIAQARKACPTDPRFFEILTFFNSVVEGYLQMCRDAGPDVLSSKAVPSARTRIVWRKRLAKLYAP